jgi:hypothetical protein
MKKITHISVGPGHGVDPEDPPKAIYVEPPSADVLEARPFDSGRHRLERMPEGEDAGAPVTLWTWTEGDA